jgi:spermidine synthase
MTNRSLSSESRAGARQSLRRRVGPHLNPAASPAHAVQSKKGAWLPVLLLFASGLASLTYQVLWVKRLSLVVGADVYAITVAVSAFFAGLALGSHICGRYADRLAWPFFFYALLEVGTAVMGVASTLLLAHAGPWFAALENHAGGLAWLLPFLLVGVPATFMGGTLPVLVRALAQATGQLATAAGRLYAANTAGAIAGTCLTTFYFIPTLGIRGSAFAAGGINLVAALAAFVIAKTVPAFESAAESSAKKKAATGNRLALVLYAIAGGLALGYEVVWSHALVQWTSTRTFAFAVVLAVYLTGLTLGSAWFARRAARSTDPWGNFGLLIAAAGLCALLEILLVGSWLPPLQVRAATLAFYLTHQEAFAMAARFVVAALCLVFLPTFLLGAAFPAALRLTAGAGAGRDTGLALALNTAGGIVGTLVAGFFLIPHFGSERSLAILAIGAALIGAIAVWRGTQVRPRLRLATLTCGGLTLVASVVIPPDHLAQLLATEHHGKLLFHEESAGGTVAVIGQQDSESNHFRRLYIQGVSNSGDAMTSLRYMRLQVLLPLIIHRGEPRSALVIGLGTGITAGALLQYPGLEHRVCAELLPAVAHGATNFQGNYGVTTDSRLEIRLRDGRRELLRSPERYDLITLEPPPPSASGVVNLYSRDFYALAAARLNPNGLVAQWLPLPTQTDEDTRSLVRSFLDVFPNASLWTTELHEMLLIGSREPMPLDAAQITARFQQPEVAGALREVGIASPAALLATWVTDRIGLEHYAGDIPPTTDDRPRIEYGRWVLPDDFLRTLQDIMAQRSDPPLVGADAGLLAQINQAHDTLYRFYEAGLYAYQGDQTQWEQAMAAVLQEDGENPYYHWFVSGDASAAPAKTSTQPK